MEDKTKKKVIIAGAAVGTVFVIKKLKTKSATKSKDLTSWYKK